MILYQKDFPYNDDEGGHKVITISITTFKKAIIIIIVKYITIVSIIIITY
ncbi:MAG: hypothetical protein GY823_02535 [Flavobacteriaceae bacterium]|nr:hypothetical protein [Flavobacteriaceae bacterium]